MVLVGYERRHRETVDWFSDYFNLPHRCMVHTDGQCNETAVKGHVIPISRLRLIADGANRVITSILDTRKQAHLENMMRRDSDRQELFHFERRNINNPSMTRRIACAKHDNDVFSAVDDLKIDWEDPRNLALISYRSILARIFIDQYTTFFNDKVKLSNIHGYFDGSIREKRNICRLRIEFEIMLRTGEFDSWCFETIRVDNTSTVAASAVFVRRPTLGEHRRLGNSILLPGQGLSLKPVPIIVTIYPDENGQIAVIAYPTWADRIARIMVAALNEKDRWTQSALLSMTILEETEIIMISSEYWNTLTSSGQELIEKYFLYTMPGDAFSYERPDLDPRLFNLFAMNPIDIKQ